MARPAEKVLPLRVSAVRATTAHIARIATNAREADRRELWAGWRHTPKEALEYGLAQSSHAWTGLSNLQPFVMFGVVPANLLCGEGRIWLIGTDEILTHQVTFLRRSKPMLARMQAMYSRLSNYVAADNEAAVRWLSWLGFTIEPAQPFGASGALFHHFHWSRADV